MKTCIVIMLMLFTFSCNSSSPLKSHEIHDLEKEPKSKQDKINEAKIIISRAKEMCAYIPDSNSKNMIVSGLSQLIVICADSNETVQLSSDKLFVLLITNENCLVKGVKAKSKAMFDFSPDELEKNGHVLIEMNEDLSNYSNNLDAKASCLIHEFAHAIQSNNRHLPGIKTKDNSRYVDEDQAWAAQYFIYAAIHPEIDELHCDCDKFEIHVITPEQEIICSDLIIRSLVMYHCCRDKFLKRLYSFDRKNNY